MDTRKDSLPMIEVIAALTQVKIDDVDGIDLLDLIVGIT